MTLAQWQSFLMWGGIVNYAILLLTFVVWVASGDAVYRLHARWFQIERNQCHAAIYLMLGLYKLGIWLLFIVPWISLCIVSNLGGAP